MSKKGQGPAKLTDLKVTAVVLVRDPPHGHPFVRVKAGFPEQVLTPDDGEATAEGDLASPTVERGGLRG